MKCGLVGGSYPMRSINFNAERSINLYPVRSEVEGSKDIAAMYGTPGTLLYNGLLTGRPCRGLFSSANGSYLASVFGDTFYINGSAVGSISDIGDDQLVYMAENGLQLMLVDPASGNGYIYTYASGVFAQISDPDFPGATSVTFMDGFFVISSAVGTPGQFNWSALYDGLSWAALDFANAESCPDGIVYIVSVAGKLAILGKRTTEFWYTSGSGTSPFARIAGGVVETGCLSGMSVAKGDNTIIWVGRDEFGAGVVYKMAGSAPQRVSTFSIEQTLARAIESQGIISDLNGFCYQSKGHLFYVLTGGDLETTLVFDLSSGLWHERSLLVDGEHQQWIGNCYASYQNRSFVGDRTNSNILELLDDSYTDYKSGPDGTYPIRRTRVFTHLYDEGKRFNINSLEVDFEGGVGLESGDEYKTNPRCILRMSTDLGHTWGNEYTAEIGKIGEYNKRVQWRRLGVQRAMTFEVSISDPVKVIICGGYFNNNGS